MNYDYNEYEDDYNHLDECQTILYTSAITSEENNKKIEEHNAPEGLLKGLNILKKSKLLKQSCFDAIIASRYPDTSANALVALNKENILTPNNINALIRYKNPRVIAELLILFKDTSLSLAQLGKDCLEILTHPAPSAIIKAISPWKKELLTTEDFFHNLKTLQETAFPEEVATILAQLHATDLCKGEQGAVNCRIIAAHFNLKELHKAIASCMPLLNINNLERHENFTGLIIHINPIDAASALLTLHENQLLNHDNATENREALLASTQHLDNIAKAFILLNKKHSLNPLTRTLIIATLSSSSSFNPATLTTHIARLIDAKLLETPSDVSYCLKTIDHPDLIEAYTICKTNYSINSKKLNLQHYQANYLIVTHSSNPTALAHAIVSLCKANIEPTHHYLSTLQEHSHPDHIANILVMLKDTILLSGEKTMQNFEILVTFTDPLSLTIRFIAFKNVFFLENAQNYFNLIMREHSCIFFSAELKTDWARIPKNYLGKKHLDDMLALIHEQSESSSVLPIIQALRNYIKKNLTPNNPEEKSNSFNNDMNSADNASINASALESARKLKDRYLLQENEIEQELQNIITWINQAERLPPADQYNPKPAISYFNRLRKYSFEEPNLNLSLRKLFAYAWRAIHDTTCWVNHIDNEQLEKALEQARHMFLEGLYECLTANQGSPMCFSGSFNKIIEKLTGIHVDITLNYITLQSALWKLPIIAKEEFKSYLELTKESAVEWEILRTDIVKDNRESIWNKISSAVTERVREEFNVLFKTESELHSFCYDGKFALSRDVLSLFEQYDQFPSYSTNPHTLYSTKKYLCSKNELDSTFQPTEKSRSQTPPTL